MAEPALWMLDDGRTMGGGQRFALRLLRYARSVGRGAVLVAPSGSQVAREAASSGLQVVSVAFPNPSRPIAVIRAARALRRALKEAPAGALVVSGAARCQLVAVVGGLPVVCLMHEQDSAARRSARMLRFAGPLVAMGANAQAAYAATTHRPVARIDNILDPSELEQMLLGRSGPVNTERPALGVVARLIPEKGIKELVEELAGTPAEWSTLRVAAPPQDTEYAVQTQQLIVEAGLRERVELLGEISDVQGFLSGVDILIVPSTGREGQPTVILEALACGRPVIVRGALMSSDYDGLPVFSYNGADLAEVLATARSAAPVDPDVLRKRFTPQAALAALEAAASR